MNECPTCGHAIGESPTITQAEMLAIAMKEKKVDCYQGQDGNYYLTQVGVRVDRQAITQALRSGWIKPKWDDATELEYWRAT